MLRDLARILLAVALMSCGRQEPGGPASGRDTDRYADVEPCAGCHADIAESYRSVAMARSFRRPAPADVIEDYTRHNRVTHGPSGFTYEMLERDGRFIQRRSGHDTRGRPAPVFEREVTFAIGSGRPPPRYPPRAPARAPTPLPGPRASQEGARGGSPGA